MDPTLSPRFELNKPNLTGDCDSRPMQDWISLILQIFLLVLTVLGNFLVIISIVVVKVLRRPKNYLILSLAVADFLVGILVLPLKINLTANCDVWNSGRVICYLWISVDTICCAASILGLTVISLDRYAAIGHPLYYRAHSTSNKAYIAIAATWISSFLLILPHWMLGELHHALRISDTGNNFAICIAALVPLHQIVGVLGVFFFPSAIMVFVYGRIGRILKAHRANNPLKILTQTTDNAGDLPDNPEVVEATPCVLKVRISEILQERKGCIMMAIVIVVFILSWLPFFTLMLVDAVSQLLSATVHLPYWIYDVLVWLGYFNSCANPFIYTMFDQDFRFAFTELICLRGFTLNSRIRSEMYSKQIGSSSGTNNSTISSRNPIYRQQILNVRCEDQEMN